MREDAFLGLWKEEPKWGITLIKDLETTVILWPKKKRALLQKKKILACLSLFGISSLELNCDATLVKCAVERVIAVLNVLRLTFKGDLARMTEAFVPHVEDPEVLISVILANAIHPIHHKNWIYLGGKVYKIVERNNRRFITDEKGVFIPYVSIVGMFPNLTEYNGLFNRRAAAIRAAIDKELIRSTNLLDHRI